MHGYKEKLKVKYDATMVIAGKFLNRIGLLETSLAKEMTPLDSNDYCKMRTAQLLIWEDKAANLAKTILLLVNLKNEATHDDLCLAYVQGYY